MQMRSEAVLTILLMAAVTALLRLSGLWLMGQVKMSPFIERWLKNLPGSLVLAIVAPKVLTGGLPEILATLGVILVMVKTKNLLLAMARARARFFWRETFLFKE